MKTLTLPAKLENLETLIDFVLSAADPLGFDQKLKYKLRLAAEEMIVNVISYAYPGTSGEVTVATDIIPEKDGISVEISDSGIPFNPLEKEAPDLTVPVKDRKIGGLGIFLLKEIMSEVSYRRENGRNILTFIKYRERA